MNIVKKFTLIFIIKLMELSLKIEMSYFRVSDIIVTRRVITGDLYSASTVDNVVEPWFLHIHVTKFPPIK